jgi:ribosomal protein L11 methyltransferase
LWQDAWVERLAWVGRDRVCCVQLAKYKRVRLEAYPKSLADARKLVKEFGGTLRTIRKETWLAPSKPSQPLRMSPTLWIAESEAARESLQKTRPQARILVVPASMAFGTGEHATTGMLGRWLARQSVEGLRVCDVGTGSGLLALIARQRGAAKVEAFDFDPVCVRTARGNEAANFPGPSRIRWSRKDVTQWTPSTTFHLVIANLYGELLQQASGHLVSAVHPGGTLVLSGILHKLEAGVLRTFKSHGLKLRRRQRKGKWVMLELAKPASAGK